MEMGLSVLSDGRQFSDNIESISSLAREGTKEDILLVEVICLRRSFPKQKHHEPDSGTSLNQLILAGFNGRKRINSLN